MAMTDDFDRARKLMTLTSIVFGAMFLGLAAFVTIIGQTGVDLIISFIDHVNWRVVSDWAIAIVCGVLMAWAAAYGWSS